MLRTISSSLKPLLKISQLQQHRAFSAACCIIGDEILNGKTRDSNANYLGKETNNHCVIANETNSFP
jgi:Na+-transporting NADH:ubiquinone oxidoreductase subunit NqrA